MKRQNTNKPHIHTHTRKKGRIHFIHIYMQKITTTLSSTQIHTYTHSCRQSDGIHTCVYISALGGTSCPLLHTYLGEI